VSKTLQGDFVKVFPDNSFTAAQAYAVASWKLAELVS
jgi:hypothetical protein